MENEETMQEVWEEQNLTQEAIKERAKNVRSKELSEFHVWV